MSRDLTSPALMYVKALCFVGILLAAAALLIVESPSWRTAALVVLIAWASARAYYFAFYVIEKYVDPSFKFSGLTSFVLYVLGRRRPRAR